MKYRKKPVVIEAFRFNTDGASAVPGWFCVALAEGKAGWRGRVSELYIYTLEGEMKVSPGDWIIQGIKGEIYPCKPDIFEATYDLVSDDHNRYIEPCQTGG